MKNIAIFGATSALAEHVARGYAADGDALFIAARDPARLQRIAADLEARGASRVAIHAIDFSRVEQFEAMLDDCERMIGRPHVVLLAYGTLGSQKEAEDDVALTRQELHINFVSPACLLNAVSRRLDKGAIIAAITSVAGERGRQSNYVYGAAKGGLSRFLEGLRHRLWPRGIAVLDIRPGFVDTPMTAHMKKGGPLWAAPPAVAADIRKAIDRRRSKLYTPWFWKHIMLVVRGAPQRVIHRTKL